MGGGTVIRDVNSEIVVTAYFHKEDASHPMLAKIWALWRTPQLSEELNFSHIIFKGDALVVNSLVSYWAWYGQMIEDV